VKRYIKVLLIISVLLLLITLSGCWDSADITNGDYISGIGIDYQDGEYTVYTQSINFANIARKESGKEHEDIPIWLRIGKGKTIFMALDDLYRTAQLRIFFNQTSAIVLCENILNKNIEEVFEPFLRSRDISYNTYIFATNSSIEKLFTTNPPLNVSQTLTVLHSPNVTYRQASYIRPIPLHTFLAQNSVASKNILLPSITVTDENSKEDIEKNPLLTINGAYIMEKNKLKGWLSLNSLKGVRWLEKGNFRSPILVNISNSPAAVISAEKKEISIKPIIDQGRTLYNIEIEVQGTIAELLQDIDPALIKKEAEDVITGEIKQTFTQGLDLQADIFKLGNVLYRKKPDIWHNIYDQIDFPLDSNSIKTISIKVNIKHPKNYKLKPKTYN
jgi:spore germination protein KC